MPGSWQIDNCCSCGQQGCPVTDGTVVATFTFTNLNVQDGDGVYTQAKAAVGSLYGHFVIAYDGAGAYEAVDGALDLFFSSWDFFGNIANDVSRTVPGGSFNPNTWGSSPTIPAGAAGIINPNGTYATVFLGLAPTIVFDPGYPYPGWQTAWNSPHGFWPAHTYPYDAATSAALAKQKCVGFEFVASNSSFQLLYRRTSTFTLTMESPVVFKLYKLKARMTIVAVWLYWDGSVLRMQAAVKNLTAWSFWVRYKVLHQTTVFDNDPAEITPGATGALDLGWPLAAAPYPDQTFALGVFEAFTDVGGSDGTLIVGGLFTAAIAMASAGWDVFAHGGPGDYTITLHSANTGNADMVLASVAVSAPGMTFVSWAFGEGSGVNAWGAGTPNGTINGNAGDVTFRGTFASPSTTLTLTYTYGAQVYTLVYSLTGLV